MQDAMKVVYGLTAAAAVDQRPGKTAPACAWFIPAGSPHALYTRRQTLRSGAALVWGPAMVGGGYAATAGVHSPSRGLLRRWARGVRDDLWKHIKSRPADACFLVAN